MRCREESWVVMDPWSKVNFVNGQCIHLGRLSNAATAQCPSCLDSRKLSIYLQFRLEPPSPHPFKISSSPYFTTKISDQMPALSLPDPHINIPPPFTLPATATKPSISSPSSSESIVLLAVCSPGHTFEVLRHDTPPSRTTVMKKTASSRPAVKTPPHINHINPARNAKHK